MDLFIKKNFKIYISLGLLVVVVFGFTFYKVYFLVNSSNKNIQSIKGTTVGKSYFSNGDTAKGGVGQSIDGIQVSEEMFDYHIHAHLTLVYNGEQIAIPKGIGIIPPRYNFNGTVQGNSLYWLHTHDATGIIHIESPVKRTFTLKNFFDIWGEPLENNNIAGFKGDVHVFINRVVYHGSLNNIVLDSHEQITLEIGNKIVPPPTYTFPEGL